MVKFAPVNPNQRPRRQAAIDAVAAASKTQREADDVVMKEGGVEARYERAMRTCVRMRHISHQFTFPLPPPQQAREEEDEDDDGTEDMRRVKVSRSKAGTSKVEKSITKALKPKAGTPVKKTSKPKASAKTSVKKTRRKATAKASKVRSTNIHALTHIHNSPFHSPRSPHSPPASHCPRLQADHI